MANSATVRKNEDGTTEVVVYGAPVSNRLRGKGPGVPREEAATAIAMVAQMTGHGGWPKGITPRILGRALRRTLPNAREKASSQELLQELIAGFNDAGTPVQA